MDRSADSRRTPNPPNRRRPAPDRPPRQQQEANPHVSIEKCTRMAISHLLDKLKPITPQLDIAHTMCVTFIQNRETGDVFSTVERTTTHEPICDIGVTFTGSRGEVVPEHFDVLKHSVSGREADLNLHSNKSVYLYFRRSSDERPITALAIISPEDGEEPPLGFDAILKTSSSRQANLCRGAGNRVPPLLLCVYRGDGPPITELAVVHQKETLPQDYHQILRTPNGRQPDLDLGRTFLAYKRDYESVIVQFQRFIDGEPTNTLLANCFACLTAGIYSYDKQTFLHALEAFTSLDTIRELPRGMLSLFIELVRDSLAAYLSYFNRDVYTKVLRWLKHVYTTRSHELDTNGFMTLLHMCMFLRHEDSREQMGKNILTNVIKQSKEARKHRERTSISADAPISVFVNSIVLDTTNHIGTVKSTEDDVIRFLTAHIIDSDFHAWVSVFVNDLFPDHFDRFMAAAVILLAKTSAQALPLKLTAKSEVIKRRIHALKLMAFFLESSRWFFKNNIEALVMLRRVVFTSFINSAITAVPAVFKTMFRVHDILWNQYRWYLKFELGVLLDVGLVGLLSSSYCTPPQKVDLLEGLMQMFRTKSALVNMFYNYDNDITNWPVCTNLIRTVSKLTEGDYHRNNPYGLTERHVVTAALKLLARFMELMARYLNAHGLQQGGDLDDQEDFDIMGVDIVAQGPFLGGLGANSPDGVSLRSGDDGSQFRGRSGSNASAQTDNMTAYEMAMLDAPRKQDDDSGSVMSSEENGSNNGSKGNIPQPVHVSHDLPITSFDGFSSDGIGSPSPNPQMMALSSNGTTATNDSIGIGPQHFELSAPIDISRDRAAGKSMIGSPGAEDAKVPENDEDGEAVPTIDLMNEESKREQVWRDLQGDFVGRDKRANTWHLRYDKHKQEQAIVEEALKLARQDKLKTGVKFLLRQGNQFASLKFIAKFLYNNETLDRLEVGEFLSSLDTSALNENQHADLILCYVGLLDFTSMTFDGAFRHFLTDCNFRLPTEAQKIERLIKAFSHAYARDNPTVFSNPDAAFVLAYASLMLQTELHNPNARKAALGGQPMTKAQFFNMVSSTDDNLSESMIFMLYDSIAESPIVMKLQHQYNNNDSRQDVTVVQKQFRDECTRLVRRAQASMREMAVRKHHWQRAPNVDIVKALYEITWHNFLAAITTVLLNFEMKRNNMIDDGSETKEDDTIDPMTPLVCLDGLKYSGATAIQLGLLTELRAFTNELAKYVYGEENKHLPRSNVQLAIVRGAHLDQNWVRTINSLAANMDSRHVASSILSRVCNDMKARVLYDHHQSILLEIEQHFGGELYLVNPYRRYIHNGLLTKQSSKGDLVAYKFYLFNDIMLYVSEKNNGRFTVHRVLNLSLCRVADLRDGFVRNVKNAFRIISPQKTIVLLASDVQEKREWINKISEAINTYLEHRREWMNEHYQELSDLHETQRFSRFLGRTVEMKKHEIKRVQAAKEVSAEGNTIDRQAQYQIDIFERHPPCKLCQRPFKRFTRRLKCPWCLDWVCKSCMRRKAVLPTSRKQMVVCDGCFGVIHYFEAEMNNQEIEFSVTDTTFVPRTQTNSSRTGGIFR